MSHVDDGRIHAWLDGALLPGAPERVALEAHLAACDECRARVEAERIIRDRAADVLRSAAPDATRVQPFEQMIAARRAARAAAEAADSAGATGAAAGPEPVPGRVDHAVPIPEAPTRRRRGLIPLAWAASIMMAVTAGWFARQYVPGTGLEDGRLPTAAESDVAAGRDLRQAASSAGAPAMAPGRGGAAVIPPGAAAPAQTSRGVAEPAGRVASAETAQKAKADAEAGAADQAVSGVVRRPTEETRRLADAMVLDETRARAREAEAPSAPAFAVGGAALDAATSSALASYRNARWETVTETEAIRRLGQAPARIEGVPIDSLQVTPHEGGFLLRVVQRIGSEGASAEILQWKQAVALNELVVTGGVEQKRTDDRSGVAADSAQRRAERQAAVSGVAADRPATAPVPGRPSLQLDRIGYRLLLRADVGADSLNALAARIR